MARKVKCQICKKELTTDTAFKVNDGKRNKYYCDLIEYEIHQEEIKAKDEIYENVCDILGYKSKNTLIFKEIVNLHEVYSHKNINEYLKINITLIKDLIQQNNINKEFNKIRYIFGVISRGIDDFVRIKEKELKDKIDIKKTVDEIIKEDLNEKTTKEYEFQKTETLDFSNFFN